MMTLDQANALITACFEHARRHGLKPLAVAVLDSGGHLISGQRQDGASIGRLKIATGKASGALFMGLSSRSIAEMAVERPTFLASLGTVASDGLVAAAGGLLLSDPDDRLIAAIGISGDSSDNDEACARDAIEAMGLSLHGG